MVHHPSMAGEFRKISKATTSRSIDTPSAGRLCAFFEIRSRPNRSEPTFSPSQSRTMSDISRKTLWKAAQSETNSSWRGFPVSFPVILRSIEYFGKRSSGNAPLRNQNRSPASWKPGSVFKVEFPRAELRLRITATNLNLLRQYLRPLHDRHDQQSV